MTRSFQVFYSTVFFIVILGQTTQPLSYNCPVNDVTTEFSLVSSFLSHSAFNFTTNCSVPQCNSSNHDCRTSQTPCFDYRTQDNISYCAPASDCSILEPCNGTCSSNSSICVANSCCEPKARCLPLIFTTFCSSMSATTPTSTSTTATTTATATAGTTTATTTTTTATATTTTITTATTTTTATATTATTTTAGTTTATTTTATATTIAATETRAARTTTATTAAATSTTTYGTMTTL